MKFFTIVALLSATLFVISFGQENVTIPEAPAGGGAGVSGSPGDAAPAGQSTIAKAEAGSTNAPEATTTKSANTILGFSLITVALAVLAH
ncbi:unnamed protein product [Caenorhabditis bovis]|uniref:Uncharacterized protein n=1 Tax=Caenorhabditis bovis TaxID=2654633 RepID=A0A8S1F119_9PELO|nr:unnamed protein product [Caenorhabditis bovis]